MVINAKTKIGSILKEKSDALEAIISISPKFEKLRNPVLRKLMAGRTSIATASKIGGCKVSDFFVKLKPLGFDIDESQTSDTDSKEEVPAFIRNLQKQFIEELDVRPLIDSGKDPLTAILQKINTLNAGQVLKIINSFYPEPLILLLKKQGFDAYADVIDDNLVETYFRKTDKAAGSGIERSESEMENWNELMHRYEGRLEELDVRHLAMPLPMLTILEALEKIPADKALFVYHKRIPVFLIPELKERKFSYCIREISEGEVHLLICRD